MSNISFLQPVQIHNNQQNRQILNLKSSKICQCYQCNDAQENNPSCKGVLTEKLADGVKFAEKLGDRVNKFADKLGDRVNQSAQKLGDRVNKFAENLADGVKFAETIFL